MTDPVRLKYALFQVLAAEFIDRYGIRSFVDAACKRGYLENKESNLLNSWADEFLRRFISERLKVTGPMGEMLNEILGRRDLVYEALDIVGFYRHD